MLRILLPLLLLTSILSPTAARGQNPFLENQGRRTIQSIRFVGQERTKLYVLERELGFSVGDEYDAAAVNDAWARLEELPFVAYIEIETERPRPGQAELTITVVEEGIFRWQIGLDYSRRLDSKWYGDLRLGTVNALGRADELELRLNAWALRQARLRWTNPWILGAARLGGYADVGVFSHAWVYTPPPDAENSEIAVETGLIGVVGLVLFFGVLYRLVIALPPGRRYVAIPALLGVLMAVSPLNAHKAFYGSFWSSLTWWLIALFVAVYGATRADASRAPPRDRAGR